ncbi:hypothetical protein BC835DRAFT_1044705 [Cytidiella melzeri]|nr:hypothetical protein BC835DRAFT_1044705 [Cytidiella melzeri]
MSTAAEHLSSSRATILSDISGPLADRPLVLPLVGQYQRTFAHSRILYAHQLNRSAIQTFAYSNMHSPRVIYCHPRMSRINSTNSVLVYILYRRTARVWCMFVRTRHFALHNSTSCWWKPRRMLRTQEEGEKRGIRESTTTMHMWGELSTVAREIEERN